MKLPQWHGNQHKRKKTGARRRVFRNKRAFEAGSDQSEVMIGNPKKVKKRSRGGNEKIKLLAINFANVMDPATNKSKKVEIRRVLKNQANVDFQRRGVITKGAIIETPIGEAVVTSRPGQEGIINAVLMKK
jgi:small subunit ribosomal protein S8e